jgi:hypothetical protein
MPVMTINPVEVPNLSYYTISTGFNLCGDTDEKSNIRLGYDRAGNVREA